MRRLLGGPRTAVAERASTPFLACCQVGRGEGDLQLCRLLGRVGGGGWFSGRGRGEVEPANPSAASGRLLVWFRRWRRGVLVSFVAMGLMTDRRWR